MTVALIVESKTRQWTYGHEIVVVLVVEAAKQLQDASGSCQFQKKTLLSPNSSLNLRVLAHGLECDLHPCARMLNEVDLPK